MNGWTKNVVSGLVGAAIVGLLAWGALSNQVAANTDQIKLNTRAINDISRENSTMAANIEWIRKALERNPNR